MGTRRTRAVARALIAAVAVASCSQEPDYVRPAVPMPASYRDTPADVRLTPPTSQWWRSFGSEELDHLVDTALANNLDLKMAVSRVAQAEAVAGVAAGALAPLIQGSNSAAMSNPPGGVPSMYPLPDGSYERLYQVGITASYEVDLWGKNRSTMDAALATAEASMFDRETVAITLVSDVVTAYFQYLSSCERADVAEKNVRNMKDVLADINRRIAIGEGTKLELAQQRTILDQAEATLPVLNTQRDQTLDRLAVLLGKPPQAMTLKCGNLSGFHLPDISVGMPSELLLRRPDIRRAEANLKAATANIGVARAQLFPSLNLSGTTGLGTFYLSNFITPGNFVYMAGANLLGTIFDNGKTRSGIRYSEAKQVELIDAYRLAVLNALRDVQDALISVRNTGIEEAARQRALDNAERAHHLSARSYVIGMVDYLTVLETERSQLRAEDDAVLARYNRLLAAVALYKSLGGGTKAAAKSGPAPAGKSGGPS